VLEPQVGPSESKIDVGIEGLIGCADLVNVEDQYLHLDRRRDGIAIGATDIGKCRCLRRYDARQTEKQTSEQSQ
jgi:hypothetical protein